MVRWSAGILKIFCSYSHKDENLRNLLFNHLSPLMHEGLVREVWYDGRIPAGEPVDAEILGHLEDADLILLLVSCYFRDSRYCYSIEMRRASERHEKRQ